MPSAALWYHRLLLTGKWTEGHGVVGDKDSLVGTQVCTKPGNTERSPPQHSLFLHRLIYQRFPKCISLHTRCYFCPVCSRSNGKRWATSPLPLLTRSVWPGFGQDLAPGRYAEAFGENPNSGVSFGVGENLAHGTKGEMLIGQVCPPRE